MLHRIMAFTPMQDKKMSKTSHAAICSCHIYTPSNLFLKLLLNGGILLHSVILLAAMCHFLQASRGFSIIAFIIQSTHLPPIVSSSLTQTSFGVQLPGQL